MARGARRHHHRLAVWGDREDRLTTEGKDTWLAGQDVTITAWPSGGTERTLTTEGEDTWPVGQDVTITAWPSGGTGRQTDH